MESEIVVEAVLAAVPLLSPVDGVIDPSSMTCHGSLHVNLWSHSDLIEKLMKIGEKLIRFSTLGAY